MAIPRRWILAMMCALLAAWVVLFLPQLAGQDFVATSGTVTFAPGQTVKTVTVKIKGDRVKERNEKFLLRMTGVTNGRAGTSGTGTIRNDD